MCKVKNGVAIPNELNEKSNWSMQKNKGEY